MLFPHSRPALARLQAYASALLLAGSVLLIPKAPPYITSHSSCLYAQRLSADTCPPQPLPAALAPSPGHCAEFGVAKCPSLCTLWADLGDLPVPPPHSQIPITTLTVQLLGLGHSSVPLTTLCSVRQEPSPVHCQVPWNQRVSIPIGRKKESAYSALNTL